MTPEKVLEVIKFYRKNFEFYSVPKAKLREDLFDNLLCPLDDVYGTDILAHCHWMLDEMEQFIKEGRLEKCFRWLGFIQGVLWSSMRFSLNELKNHSRP